MKALVQKLSTGGRILAGGALLIGLFAALLAMTGGRHFEHLGFRGAVTVWCGALLIHLGLVALARVLRSGGGACAVARVLVAETVRRRVAWICATLLLVGLAAIPYLVRSNSVLEYRLSSFLGYSLFLTTFLLSILTLFGASGSLCEEIEDRRIHSVVVKPLGRLRFLFGKWLGLLSLNSLLLAVAGLVTFSSFHWQLASAEVDPEQRARVDRLLVTHRAVKSELPDGILEEVTERAETRRARDPALWNSLVAGEGGNEAEAFIHLQRDLFKEVIAQRRTVPPEETRSFRFKLDGENEGTTRLVVAPFFGRAHSTERTRLVIRIDGAETPVFLGGRESTELPVSAEALADGEIIVEIESPDGDDISYTAGFTGKDRIFLEVTRGSLAGNLARALLILATQLGFLAAVGLAAGTFLGLPVAVLLTSMVLFAAAGGGFFGEELENEMPAALAAHDHSHDHSHGHGHSHGARKESVFVSTLDEVGRTFLRAFSAWGRYAPIDSVTSGTEISRQDLLGCFLWIGGAWTGFAGLIGGLVFRRREIARVQV